MKAVLFLSRVAFLFNLLFLLFFIGYMGWFQSKIAYVDGFIVATGSFLPIIVNAVLHIWLVLRLFSGKPNNHIPAWLKSANFLFYIFEIIFFFV
jgi:hypothetical protein